MQRRDPLRGQRQLQGSQAREPMTRDLPMDPLLPPSWPPSGCSLPSPTGRLNLNPNPEPQGPFSKTISNIVTLTLTPPSSCLPRAPPSGERYYPPSTRPTMDTTKTTTTRELTAPETTVAHGLAPLLLGATPRTETAQRHTSKRKQPTQPPPPPTTTTPRA